MERSFKLMHSNYLCSGMKEARLDATGGAIAQTMCLKLPSVIAIVATPVDGLDCGLYLK